MKFIDLKDLKLIRSIAESGSVTAAARQLHVTQPAVSQRLKKLQDRLGSKLFERQNGAMQVTPAGKRLISASHAVAHEIERAEQDIRDMQHERDHHLRITTQCYTCYRWLPFVLRDLRQAYPNLSVDVVPDATDRPFEAIEDDRVDVAIVSNPESVSQIQEKKLFSDELFAVMSMQNPLASRQYLNPSDFSDQTLLLYTGTQHAIVEEVLRPAAVTPKNIIQIRITEAIVELARDARGIAVLSGWAFSDLDNTEGLRAVRILKNGMRRSWRAAINARCDKAHVDALVKSVRRTGKIIQKDAWRKKLQNAKAV